MPSKKHNRKQKQTNQADQADLPGEVWANVCLADIQQRPSGTWLALLEDDNVPHHRLICNCFPEEVGLTDDLVNHKVSHVRCDSNPVLNLIVAKWRVQGWFVYHVDGNRGNNATTNMRVVSLREALERHESSDWGFFLTKGERTAVCKSMQLFVSGITE